MLLPETSRPASLRLVADDDDKNICLELAPGWCRVTEAHPASLARVLVPTTGQRNNKATYKILAGQLREEFKDKEMTKANLDVFKKGKRADDSESLGEKGPIKMMTNILKELKPLTEDATEFAESLSPVRRPRVRVRVCHRTRARSRDLGAARSARAGARACCVTTGGSGADHVHPGRGRLESRAAVGV